MLKQLACAAARSSSGVVLLAEPSVRAFQVRLASLNVPLDALALPLPDIRSPSHCAVALLCMVAPPCAGAFCQMGDPLATANALRGCPEHQFRCMLEGCSR